MAFKTPPDIVPADINRVRMPYLAPASLTNLFGPKPVTKLGDINRYFEPMSLFVGLPLGQNAIFFKFVGGLHFKARGAACLKVLFL